MQNTVSCNNCFFTSDFPGVSIASDGTCNICREAEVHPLAKQDSNHGLTELKKIAAELKASRTGKYDCVIGASGGLDSSFVIYLARKILDLNPIVVKYDSGLGYDLAQENLTTLCRNLGVDLKVVKSKSGHDRNFVKHIILALNGAGVYWGICTFCGYAYLSAIYKTAIDEHVPAILSNNNPYQKAYIKSRDQWRSLLSGLAKAKPGDWSRFLWHLPQALYCLLQMKREFYLPPLSNLLRRYPQPPPIRNIMITDYLVWDMDHMIKTLTSETGWRTPPPPQLPMRFDCRIETSYKNLTLMKTAGTTAHTQICNHMIHEHIRTKKELQEAVSFYPGIIDREIAALKKILGLA